MKKKLVYIFLLFTVFDCGETIVFTDYPLGTNFTISDEVFSTRSFSDFSKGVNLVFFGFTSCPDICPMGLTRMYNAFKDDTAEFKPGLFFITIDPERDTYTKIHTYLKFAFPGIQGFRLEKKSAETTLKKFGVGVNINKKNGKTDIEHSSYIFLTDKTGNVKYLIKSGMNSGQIRKIVQAYRKEKGL